MLQFKRQKVPEAAPASDWCRLIVYGNLCQTSILISERRIRPVMKDRVTEG